MFIPSLVQPAVVVSGDRSLDRDVLLEHALYLERFAEKAPNPELREARLIAASQIRKGVAS